MSDKQLMSMENKYRIDSPWQFSVYHQIPKERKLQETVYRPKDKDLFIGEGLIDKIPLIFEWSEK